MTLESPKRCSTPVPADPPRKCEPLWDRERLGNPHVAQDKARRVREMFEHIAPTYERVNRIASVGRDRHWRRRTVQLADIGPQDMVLDIACGTGDLAEAFGCAGPRAVIGVDFAQAMLERTAGRLPCPGGFCCADALNLPFADDSFDVTCCAFGVRNFADLQRGLSEMFRVLKPGGRTLILEFSMPSRTPLRQLYRLYFCNLMPHLARWISRDHTGAYDYLPQSVLNFASPTRIQELLIKVGFSGVRIRRQTFGIVYIFRADKPVPNGGMHA